MITPTHDARPHIPPRRKRLHRHLYAWVLLFIVVGALTGHFAPDVGVALKPVGSMDETVTVWEEGRRIDTANRASALVPFSRAETTLVLEPETAGTSATFDYRYVPRGGPLVRFTGPLLDRMLASTFADMLDAIDAAALAEHDEG